MISEGDEPIPGANQTVIVMNEMAARLNKTAGNVTNTLMRIVTAMDTLEKRCNYAMNCGGQLARCCNLRGYFCDINGALGFTGKDNNS